MSYNNPKESVKQRAGSIIREAYSSTPNRYNYQWPEEAAVLELDTYGLLMTESRLREVRGVYPTAEAYEKACEALEKHRKRAEVAEAKLAAVREWHQPEMTYRLMDGEDYALEPDARCCMVCQEIYPCETISILDGNR